MDLEKYAQELKNGNEKAFNVIYKETFSFVRLAIYSYVQNKETVEDLIQETYMKVNKNIANYSSNHFNNWIYTIAKNIAVDYVRKKKESRIDEDIIVDTVKHPYLNYILNHLDSTLKEVFLMKVLYGHTTKKIASILNVKPSEVNQMYYQAKEILKRNLKEDSYELEKV